MKISDLEFYAVRLPQRKAEESVCAIILRLVSDTDAEGWGECHLNWLPESLPMWRDYLLPLLAGRSIFRLEDFREIEPLQKIAGLRAGLEMACWDLIGRVANQPLCHLWGGRYREHVPLAIRIPSMSESNLSQWLHTWTEQGFYTQILSLTGDIEKDLSFIHAVKDASADHIQLQLDGRHSYLAKNIEPLLQGIAGIEVDCFIDPFAEEPEACEGYVWQAEEIPLGATISSPGEVVSIALARAADYVVIDVEKTGGLWTAKECAVVAQAAGLEVLLRYPQALGLATAALLQLAGCTRNITMASECQYEQLREDILSERLELLDGALAVPIGPGLGIEVDRGKLEEYWLF
ncbi:Hypothetical protein PBC10988_19600 [Planctomycetales bacterium 10988]|nr:Hypothetical protein PBC10988_19600 [Planctomycetales bacterium 10988]